MRRQSNSVRTKGQLAASYSGYDSSTTQLPLYASHDDETAAFSAVAAAAVQAPTRTTTRTVAESRCRRSILLPNRRGQRR